MLTVYVTEYFKSGQMQSVTQFSARSYKIGARDGFCALIYYATSPTSDYSHWWSLRANILLDRTLVWFCVLLLRTKLNRLLFVKYCNNRCNFNRLELELIFF